MRKSTRVKRILFTTLIILILFFILRYITISKFQVSDTEYDDSKVEVHMIDVGQAESILIIQGDYTMLIDTGGMFSGKTITKYVSSLGIDTIDYLIITHYHNDHAGGTARVIARMNVKKIICMDPKYCTTFQEVFWYVDIKLSQVMNNIFKFKNIKMENPYDENNNLKSIQLGGAVVDFLAQQIDACKVNNKSLVAKLHFEDFSMLFMGDAQSEVEKKLVEEECELSADVLKVGHHGSVTSTMMDFLKEVSPKYALISCGKNNPYSHPNSFVIHKLKKQNVNIFRTDINGDIVVTSDGNEIEVDTVR